MNCPGGPWSHAEREEIAILHAQQVGVREIGRRIGRPHCTISRELALNRNAGRELPGGYGAGSGRGSAGAVRSRES